MLGAEKFTIAELDARIYALNTLSGSLNAAERYELECLEEFRETVNNYADVMPSTTFYQLDALLDQYLDDVRENGFDIKTIPATILEAIDWDRVKADIQYDFESLYLDEDEYFFR